MFPIDKPSSYGFKFTVYQSEIESLKQDADFIKDYLLGVKLLAESWGWDLEHARFIPYPQPGQSWHRWPIRLHKCAYSLSLFGFEDELKSMVKYGNLLLDRGESFMYNGRDLGNWFRDREG